MFLCFKVIESKSMNSFGKVKGWEKRSVLLRRIWNQAIPKETWDSVTPQQKHRSVQGLECNYLSKSKNSSSVNQGMPAYTESHSFPDILRVHIPIQTQMCIYTCRVIVLGWTSRIACIFSDAPNNLNYCITLYYCFQSTKLVSF